MSSKEPTRVFITGATSGLGRELVRQLACRGWKIAFSGRREAKLEETREIALAAAREAGKEPELMPLVGSVNDLELVKAHHQQITDAWGGVDWAILNAGVGDTVSALDFKAEHIRWVFETNIVGMANCLEAVLPGMIERDSGVVVGIASLAGIRGLPTSAGYSASKAAVAVMLESLRVDLRHTGVDVLTVSPGYIKSEITARNDPKQMLFLLETDDGVRRLIRGIEKRRSYISFPWQLSWFCRLIMARMPCWMYDMIASKIKRKKKKYVDESAKPEALPAASEAAAAQADDAPALPDEPAAGGESTEAITSQLTAALGDPPKDE